jgi:hypothetical protein
MNRDQVRGVQNERNTEMKSLSSAEVIALTLAFLVASPTAFAAESLISDRALDGRPISEITATLASRELLPPRSKNGAATSAFTPTGLTGPDVC